MRKNYLSSSSTKPFSHRKTTDTANGRGAKSWSQSCLPRLKSSRAELRGHNTCAWSLSHILTLALTYATHSSILSTCSLSLHSLSLSLTLSHTHNFLHSHAPPTLLSLRQTLFTRLLALSFSLSHTQFLAHTHTTYSTLIESTLSTRPLALSLFLTDTHTHSLSHTHMPDLCIHTCARTHSLTHSPCQNEAVSPPMQGPQISSHFTFLACS